MGVLVSERERCERLYHDNPKEWEDRKYLNRLKKQRQWTESKRLWSPRRKEEKRKENKSSLIKTLIHSPIYIITSITHRAALGHIQRARVNIIRVYIYHLKAGGPRVYNGRVRCAFIREAATLRPG